MQCICTVLKKQTCDIHKCWSYNMNLKVCTSISKWTERCLHFLIVFHSVFLSFFLVKLKWGDESPGYRWGYEFRSKDLAKWRFSNFSCRFINPNYFFPISIVLIHSIRKTSRNKLKEHSVTKNYSDLSLFEEIVLVLSKILQILGLQLRISKVFLDH